MSSERRELNLDEMKNEDGLYEFDESKFGIRLIDGDGNEYYIHFDELRKFEKSIVKGEEFDHLLDVPNTKIKKSQRVKMLTEDQFGVFMR